MTTWTLAQNWDAGSRRSSIEGRQDSRRNTASLLLVAVFERERPEDSILTIAGSTMTTWTLAQNWDAGSRRSSIEGRQDSRRSTASLLLVAVFETLEPEPRLAAIRSAESIRKNAEGLRRPRTLEPDIRLCISTIAQGSSILEPEPRLSTTAQGP